MNSKWLIPGLVTTWLIICAVIDAKQGEVSNWLTLPAMTAGVISAISLGGERLILLAAVFAGLMILYVLGSMGGADVKVLTALAGLWPIALFIAFIVQGIWGVVILIKKGRGKEFRAIPAYAIGALLSIVLLV